MIVDILSYLSSLIINIISTLGYTGIVVLSSVESACVPIPSEVVMPFSGYLAQTGRLSLLAVGLLGTLGNLIGSLIAYAVGYWGGRPFIRRWGKYVFLREEELNQADNWFEKYGSAAVFFSRMLPVVRTFISLPAGIGRMQIFKFSLYTILGSLPWNFALAYTGWKLGQNWQNLEYYFRKFDYLILGFIFLGVFWWLWRHMRNKR